MRQALKEIAPSQRRNQDTKSLKQARNKKVIQQKEQATLDEPSRARAWGARPGQTQARPGAELKPSQAELPPARPGSTVFSSNALVLSTIVRGSFSTVSRPFLQRIRHIIAP